MPTNLENSAVATGLERSVFIPIPKKGNAKNVQAGLEKAEEPEIKLPTSLGSQKKQESSRTTSTYALLNTLKPLTVWITTNYEKFLKRWELPEHLTCLLRNLHAGQEATVRTENETTDWFQIRKGIHQGCI